MLIPHIIFHPIGCVVEETAELFFEFTQESNKASFFKELIGGNLPVYFNFEERTENL